VNYRKFNDFYNESLEVLASKGYQHVKKNSTFIYVDKSPVSAYFCQEDKVIVTSKLSWRSCFIHEYSHFLQYEFSNKEYTKFLERADQSLIDFYAWLYDEKKLSKRKLLQAICLIQKLELDAEKMTVDIFIERNLDMNLEKYIKEANAYILSYTYMMEHKVGFPLKKHYPKALIDAMPSKFISSFEIPKKAKTFFDVYFSE